MLGGDGEAHHKVSLGPNVNLPGWVFAIVGTIIRTSTCVALCPCALNFLSIHALALSTDSFDGQWLVALDLNDTREVAAYLVGAENQRVEVFRLDNLVEMATHWLVRLL